MRKTVAKRRYIADQHLEGRAHNIAYKAAKRAWRRTPWNARHALALSLAV